MEWMTVKDASELWGISGRRVQILCETGRVYGAERLGNMWVIPKGTHKPIDGRTKAAKENQSGNKDNRGGKS
jgi:hypothetical protein